MKASGKIRFILGIIGVMVVVGILSLILANTMATSHSVRATLDAQPRSVGTDYSGLVVRQLVEEGARVEKGDVLFELDSQSFKQQLADDRIDTDELAVTVTDENNIELRANNGGVVDEIFFREGAYVPSNAVVATIHIDDSMFVTAYFQLSPPDYARIDQSSSLEVLFPDNTIASAKITSVNLESAEDTDAVETVVTAKLENVDSSEVRFTAGTPVDATLHLERGAWYEELQNFVERLFTPRGS